MLSIEEASRRLSISSSKLKKMIAAGEIHSVKVGDRRLVPLAALQTFANSDEVESSRVHLADGAKPVRSPRVTARR
jgi:excisionase family DNA binding protein